MQSILKKLLIFIVIVLLIVAFSSSYNALNIDNLAFVVALGFDVSDIDENKIKLTFQFVNPPSTNEGSNQESKIIQNSVEADSLANAINLMNTYLARRIDLSHCRIIVFSEEIAKRDISDYVYSLMNDVNVRPTANIIVSKCTSSYYIENCVPNLETSITKYYDLFPTSNEYTGYLPNATIGQFFNSLACTYCQPYAILGGVSASNTSSQDNNTVNAETKSGSSPIFSANRASENIGMAVFHEGKLAGELNAIETVSFHILENDVDSFLITIPNPEKNDANLDIFVYPKSSTKVDVDIVNDSLYIKVDCSFSAKIYSISPNTQFLDNTILSSISSSCNKYLKTIITDYLYKTSLDFKSDINGIGKHVLKKFTTNKEFEVFNWNSNYHNATFDVTVNTNIDSNSLLTQVQS